MPEAGFGYYAEPSTSLLRRSIPPDLVILLRGKIRREGDSGPAFSPQSSFGLASFEPEGMADDRTIVGIEILWTLVIHPRLVRRTKKLRGTRLSMEHTGPTRRHGICSGSHETRKNSNFGRVICTKCHGLTIS